MATTMIIATIQRPATRASTSDKPPHLARTKRIHPRRVAFIRQGAVELRGRFLCLVSGSSRKRTVSGRSLIFRRGRGRTGSACNGSRAFPCRWDIRIYTAWKGSEIASVLIAAKSPQSESSLGLRQRIPLAGAICVRLQFQGFHRVTIGVCGNARALVFQFARAALFTSCTLTLSMHAHPSSSPLSGVETTANL